MELTPALVRLPMDLSPASVDAFSRAFEAALCADAPAVVISGASDDVYCLGLAIGEATDGSLATSAFASLLAAMHRAPKPLIAAVDGKAIGGGMGIACACDWVIATDRACFGLPELLWGLVPAIIWPVITDRMAPHVARQWALTGHARTPFDGLAAGLVDEIAAPNRLAASMLRATRRFRRLDPSALVQLRLWARASRQQDLESALHAGAAITADMVQRPNVRARWQAFIEGGAPWSA